MTAALEHWARSRRTGSGWPNAPATAGATVTYAEALERISALAGGLRDLGVVGERPLLILARNGIDHALIAYAAMSQGMPVAPVSPQYGLTGANLARLDPRLRGAEAGRRLHRGRRLFADGLAAPALAGLPVIAGRNARPGDVRWSDLSRGRRRDRDAGPARQVPADLRLHGPAQGGDLHAPQRLA
jgi:feruloyl-CoA synthase